VVLHKTSDWPAFEDYARNCKVGFYMVSDDVGGRKRVRVRAGRLAYDNSFDLKDHDQDTLYTAILEFCKIQGFIRIEGSVAEEVFFS